MHARAQDLLRLSELPQLAPPAGVWERVLEGVGARAAARRYRRRAALAAAVVVVAAAIPLTYAATREAPPPTWALVRLAPERVQWDETSYAPLIVESARLERVLAQMPPPPPLVVGTTAGTVVGLEDRIAYVDAQLSYAAARDLSPPYRKALWSQRVELMNALVQVRFAQTQGF
ncbi:MAG TPA: hypothetical protein VF405_16085 [Gammaproteobacteria bacterium]